MISMFAFLEMAAKSDEALNNIGCDLWVKIIGTDVAAAAANPLM